MAGLLERRKCHRPRNIAARDLPEGLPVSPILVSSNIILPSLLASSDAPSTCTLDCFAELDAPDCDGAPEQWDAELRWLHNPDTTEPLPSPRTVRHLQGHYANCFRQAQHAGLSIQTISCATTAFAQAGFPESSLLGDVQSHKGTAAGDLFYHPFKLTSAEKDIGWRRGGNNIQHMWGVHATSKRNLAYILRDGLRSSFVTAGGAGPVTVIGMKRSWDQEFHIDCVSWIRKSMMSSYYNQCNVLVEVAWAGVHGEKVVGSCAAGPGQTPTFKHAKGPGSAYLVHPCDIVITGLWYVSR